MRIGILETGFPPKDMQDEHGTYPAMFERLLDGHGFEFRSWPVLLDEIPSSPSEADGWLITGSKYGVYDDLPWIRETEEFVRRVVEARVPLVGICFGHQLMAQALGGEVAKSDRGWGIGGQTYLDHETGRNIRILASHQDQVTRQPEGTRLIASSEFCPIAGLAWEDAPAISWQAHPEFRPAFSRALIEDRIGTVYGEAIARTALDGLEEPLDSPAIATRIARFFKDHAARKAA